MTFIVSGQPLTKYERLTDNTAKVIFTASKRTTIVSLAFTETKGGTQTLAVVRSDGSTDYYLRRAKAVTAGERVLLDEVFALSAGDTLKAQSSDATGGFDVMVTYLAPDAAASR